MQQIQNQQYVISGVGGQGVLFITRLLAEAAILKGLPVFTAETHGMAQRGGIVLSHLKVGNFYSPLIRPFQADGLIALKAEAFEAHKHYLKPDSWAVVNQKQGLRQTKNSSFIAIDANHLAKKIDNLRSINLIMLGFAMAKAGNASNLFCTKKDLEIVLSQRLANNKNFHHTALKAFNTGFSEGRNE